MYMQQALQSMIDKNNVMQLLEHWFLNCSKQSRPKADHAQSEKCDDNDYPLVVLTQRTSTPLHIYTIVTSYLCNSHFLNGAIL